MFLFHLYVADIFSHGHTINKDIFFQIMSSTLSTGLIMKSDVCVQYAEVYKKK